MNMGQITKSPIQERRSGINKERLMMSLASGSLVEQGSFSSDCDFIHEHIQSQAHPTGTSWGSASNQQRSGASTDTNALISLSTSESSAALSRNKMVLENIWESLYEPTDFSSVASNSPYVSGIGYYLRHFQSRDTRSPLPNNMNSLAHHANFKRALCALLPYQLVAHDFGKLSCDRAIVYTTIYQLVNDLVPLRWENGKDEEEEEDANFRWKLDKRYKPIQIVMSYLQNGGAQTSKRIRSICDGVPAPFRNALKRRLLDFAAKAAVPCVVKALLKEIPADDMFDSEEFWIMRDNPDRTIWREIVLTMLSSASEMTSRCRSQLSKHVGLCILLNRSPNLSADDYKFFDFVFNTGDPLEIVYLNTFVKTDNRRILQRLLDAAANPRSTTLRYWIENHFFARVVAQELSEINSSWVFETILRVLPGERRYDQVDFESKSCHGCSNFYIDPKSLADKHFSHHLSGALCIAIRRSQWTTAELLLRAKVLPKACCLISVVRKKNRKMVTLLLKASVNPSVLIAATFRIFGDHYMEVKHHFLWNSPYAEAIRSGFVEASKFASFDPERSQNRTSMLTCLVAASEIGNVQLIGHYLSLMRVQPSLYTSTDVDNAFSDSLQGAIRSRCAESVAKLLDAGALVSQPEIFLAVQSRQKAMLYSLLGYFHENHEVVYGEQEPSEVYLHKILIEAVRWEDISVIDHLLRYGIFQPHLQSALSAAVNTRNHAVIDKILDHGVAFDGAESAAASIFEHIVLDVNLLRVNEWLYLGLDPASGLVAAIDARNQALIRLLIQATSKRYPKGNAPHAADALVAAVKSKDIGIVNVVAEYFRISIDLPHGSKKCRRLARGLNSAIFIDGLETPQMVQTLLEYGADPNSIIDSCESDYSIVNEVQTPLTLAIFKNSMEKVDLLLKHKADLNMSTKWGLKRTPFQVATQFGTHEMIKHLWEKGADINARAATSGGATALQLAAIRGDTKIAEFLLSKKADLLAPPAKRHGRTPFEGAAEHGRVDMMILLVEEARRQGIDLFQDGEEQIERAIKFATANRQPLTKRMAEDMLHKVREKRSYEQVVHSWEPLQNPQQVHWHT
jgi:hypothetical protein